MKQLILVSLLAVLTFPAMSQTDPFRGGAGGGQAVGTSSQVPLPVELIALSGIREPNNSVALRWTTASEQNNAGFEVWRTQDTDNWYKIGFVEGKGTSYTVNHYVFRDASPLSATSYYKLKQVDTDGKATFSKIIAIAGGTQQMQAAAWPIPAQDFLTVQASNPETPAILKLYTADQGLLAQRAFQKTTQLDMRQLPAGLYLLHILQANQALTVIKLMKAK